MTLLQAAAALRRREASSVELTQTALERIERLNGKLHAFITVAAPQALEAARRADAEISGGGHRGPLHGIPLALKDLFDMSGVPTTGGSPIHADRIAQCNSTVVDRLEAAGAVIVGKLNLHELAYGITSANLHYGPVRNPWNPDYSPGGSSGGSAVAVVTGMVFAAMGTDTGGSIRIPSAFCGAVGLKPTYGRVSRAGVLPLAWSLDHVGPLAGTVRDAAHVFQAVAGHDPRDPTSSRRRVQPCVPARECSIRGLSIGFARQFFERLDPDVESAARGALARAQSLGADVRTVQPPEIERMNAVARVIQLAEASAMIRPYLSNRAAFGPGVLALFDQGLLVPAVDYIDAQRLRRALQQEFDRLWRDVDCLLAPSTANMPPKIGQTTVELGGVEEDVRLATTRLARLANLLGLPALSIPCGLGMAGLPIGVQIIGPRFREDLVLRVGAALEDSGLGILPPLSSW
jgi:aspartyl-tRNA(Asn)/glutamyl-tRNA(Gln) amidotransferase subunit A